MVTVPSGAPFDIFELIRRTLATSPESDPHVVGQLVALQLTDAELRPALEQCLPLVARHLSTAGRTTTSLANNARAGRQRHTKDAAQLHVLWSRIIRQRESTKRGWIFLGDCTGDDLLDASDARLKAATGNLDMAQRLNQLYAVLPPGGVVSDIPPDVLVPIFQS